MHLYNSIVVATLKEDVVVEKASEVSINIIYTTTKVSTLGLYSGVLLLLRHIPKEGKRKSYKKYSSFSGNIDLNTLI